MKIKLILLTTVFLHTTSLLGAELPVFSTPKTAGQIHKDFLDQAKKETGITEKAQRALEGAGYLGLGSFSGIGLGLLATNYMSKSLHCEMAPIIGTGGLFGGIAGVWWYWNGRGEYSSSEHNRAERKMADNLVQVKIDTRRLEASVGVQTRRAETAETNLVHLRNSFGALSAQSHQSLLFLVGQACDDIEQQTLTLEQIDNDAARDRIRRLAIRRPNLVAFGVELRNTNAVINPALQAVLPRDIRQNVLGN